MVASEHILLNNDKKRRTQIRSLKETHHGITEEYARDTYILSKLIYMNIHITCTHTYMCYTLVRLVTHQNCAGATVGFANRYRCSHRVLLYVCVCIHLHIFMYIEGCEHRHISVCALVLRTLSVNDRWY